jgi:hypothetical protein
MYIYVYCRKLTLNDLYMCDVWGVTTKAKSSCICEKREVVPRVVKSTRYPALLGKSRTCDKITQN